MAGRILGAYYLGGAMSQRFKAAYAQLLDTRNPTERSQSTSSRSTSSNSSSNNSSNSSRSSGSDPYNIDSYNFDSSSESESLTFNPVGVWKEDLIVGKILFRAISR